MAARLILTPTTATDATNSGLHFLYGWSFRESGGTADTVILRDTDGSGDILQYITLAANSSANFFLDPSMAISSTGGVYVVIGGTGTVAGVLYGTA